MEGSEIIVEIECGIFKIGQESRNNLAEEEADGLLECLICAISSL